MNILLEKLRKDGNLVGLKFRPARALIGWIPEREAQIALGIPLNLVTPLREHVRRVRDAHAAVESRPTGVDQTHLLADTGEELHGYLADLQGNSACKAYMASGQSIGIADLNEVCALQPIVHLDYTGHSEHLKSLMQGAVQEDMLSIAKITLPIPSPAELPLHFDAKKNAWIFQSENPQIRIIRNFSTRVELAPGLFGMAFGFCAASLPSFVQVVLHRGRYFLKDGYHRSLALLQKGITHIPVMFQELPDSQNLIVAGRFPDEIILGPHPPLFRDYLRDDVAASISHPAPRKTITIQPTEEMTWGE